MIEGIFKDFNSVENGGNIYRLAEELKIQERKVIDFSSSVNQLGVSKKVKAEIRKHLKYLHNYPDPEAKRLRKRLAQYHGIDLETILCGNGSTELIYLIVRTLKPQKVLIPAPTFSEYEKACSISCKSQVTSYELKKEDDFNINTEEFVEAMKGCDMAFLCNPNNPTGRLLKKDDVRNIAEKAKELECYLIVDEAYIDFCPDDSVISDTKDNPFLIILRTMSPFYALPGLRIGYSVFPRHLTGILKEHKEPWTVNNLSQRAAVVALKDKVYRNETFRLINEEKGFLERSFKKIGIEFFDSDANFYLLKMNNASEICRQLKIKGILVRDCSNFRGLDSTYLRVAVKSHRENTILIKELTSILQNEG
ncbi:MAG: threonine-phosphate decarboxylase [Nitrospirae bacterium RBG_13_43_8]|nr:MAG: threonine-phosphate decarboxylase [Nitrospirae bacterium RBG_13_43_8]